MRRYRTFDASAISQFIPTNSAKNSEFERSDLAKSGLDPDDMETSASGMIRLVDGATAGYTIPYFDLQGNPLVDNERRLTMYRTKFEFPVGVKGPRYLSPSAETLAKYQLPVSIPYIPPQIHEMKSNELIIAEGEKKTASIIKLLQLPAIGIGGCQMWRDPDGSGNPHPWILGLLRSRGTNSVIIVPDGDISRYDISTAYGTLSRSLEYAGFCVQILHPPGKIDDLLVQWGDKRAANWAEIPKRSSADLVQSPKSLITRYSLSFKADAKGNPTVHQHTSNVMRLMVEHPAFPKVWLNEDINTIMIGEEKSEPNKTDMDLANYFQYNLGFDKITDRIIHNCVLSLGRENRKSPFLDYIRGLEWDGQSRLDNWLTDIWGCENTSFNKEVAAKWLVGACARLDKPGTKLDWMMIVVGPQETGKTTMPRIMFKGHANPLYGSHNDKDLHMLMHSTLCTIFDELDSFTKKDASNLKAMVTTNEDMFRPPYGISTEVFPRRFTLYGCGNRYEFLQHDPSGYRRFAVVEVTRLLDFKRLEADKDQLWAEAWHRYNNENIDYWRVNGASAEAQKHVIPNVFQERVESWIETEKFKKQGTMISGGYLYFTVSQILDDLEVDEYKSKELAGILRTIPGIEFPKYAITGPMGGPVKKRYYKVALTSE
jgi:hypothetical protein